MEVVVAPTRISGMRTPSTESWADRHRARAWPGACNHQSGSHVPLMNNTALIPRSNRGTKLLRCATPLRHPTLMPLAGLPRVTKGGGGAARREGIRANE